MVRTMNQIEPMLRATLASARARDWVAYRMRFASLRDALRESPQEMVRRHLDVLSAAAPEHDAEGCVAELEALAAELGAPAPDAAPAAPAAVDLRGLQPPEPIVRIFRALESAPRSPLRVILPHEPVPLYDMLRQRGFRYSGAPRPDGGFELLIEAAGP